MKRVVVISSALLFFCSCLHAMNMAENSITCDAPQYLKVFQSAPCHAEVKNDNDIRNYYHGTSLQVYGPLLQSSRDVRAVKEEGNILLSFNAVKRSL